MAGREQRTAVVTGGSSGIGRASVVRLRAAGLRVIAADIDGAADERLDVTDAAAVEQFASAVGRVDVLVNSAGIVGATAPFSRLQSSHGAGLTTST